MRIESEVKLDFSDVLIRPKRSTLGSRKEVDLFRNYRFRNSEAGYGGVPIIAALKGAVVGGGLELASAAHVRVADQSTYFALPEGQRGLFTGGGATIRVADLVGKARMIDMMLTGRVYKQEEAFQVGLCQYLIDGSSDEKVMEVSDTAYEVERVITLAQGSDTFPEQGMKLKEHLVDIEKRIIQQALNKANGNVSQTARLLSLQRTTLIEKINKYGLSESV